MAQDEPFPGPGWPSTQKLIRFPSFYPAKAEESNARHTKQSILQGAQNYYETKSITELTAQSSLSQKAFATFPINHGGSRA